MNFASSKQFKDVLKAGKPAQINNFLASAAGIRGISGSPGGAHGEYLHTTDEFNDKLRLSLTHGHTVNGPLAKVKQDSLAQSVGETSALGKAQTEQGKKLAG